MLSLSKAEIEVDVKGNVESCQLADRRKNLSLNFTS